MTRQIERLRPHQIEEALAERSMIYLPLGTIEWHCHHLPVGLDALTAHGLCLRAAEKSGGLVWPTLYYGTGGDHGQFPWTIVMPDAGEIEALLKFTLKRLAQLDVQQVILFSGHFADTQLEMIDRIVANWNLEQTSPVVRALAVNRAPIANFPPDHAGLFETELLEAIEPGLSDIARLGSSPDDQDRFDPSSPLWGIVGTDPRLRAPISGDKLALELVKWLEASGQA